MKKLLIAMTAAAVGTCAWATDADPEPTTPTVTYLDESFSENWTLADNELGSYTNAFWSYTGDAETELAITNVAAANAEANYALALNTGSKVLTANFADNKSAVSIAERAYFNATVTFKDPSDTLPELGPNDKFALVVLDNIESVDAGKADTNTTNLWVIAGHKDGKRAYLLHPFSEPTTSINLTEGWLSTPKAIEVKAYSDVMAGDGVSVGFLVMVDSHVCTVLKSYPIVDKIIDFKSEEVEETEYLGYEDSEIDASVRLRYTDKQLLISAVSYTTLTSVDFQGQGIIDNVSLKDAATGNFGTDSLAIEVTADDGVTLTGDCAEGTLYYSGDSAVITFKLDNGYKLKGVSTNAVEGVDGVYSLTINPNEYTQNGFNVEAFWPVVSFVTGTDSEGKDIITERGSLSEAIKEVATGAILKLTDDNALTAAITVDKNITINLNGKKLSAALSGAFTSMFKLNGGVTLTITDTANGVLEVTGINRVLASSNRGVATVAINKGTIDAACAVGSGQTTINYVITGGKFLKEANEGGITVSDAYKTVEEGNYLKVVAKETFGLTVNKHEGVTITDVNGSAFSFNNSYLEGTVLSFKVSYDMEAYQNLSVKVNDNDCSVNEGVYSFTVAAVTVLDIQVTAISTGPTIDDEDGAITVDQNTGNATIDTTNATVTVTGTVTGDVIVTPSVGTVNVKLAQDKAVKVYFEGKNITGAFTVTTEGNITTINLDPNGVVVIGDEEIKVMPEMAAASDGDAAMKAPLEVGTDVAVGVKTIPGLKYQLIRSDAPNGTFGDVDGASATGTGYPVKLEDTNRPSGKGFYKVKVSQR